MQIKDLRIFRKKFGVIECIFKWIFLQMYDACLIDPSVVNESGRRRYAGTGL